MASAAARSSVTESVVRRSESCWRGRCDRVLGDGTSAEEASLDDCGDGGDTEMIGAPLLGMLKASFVSMLGEAGGDCSCSREYSVLHQPRDMWCMRRTRSHNTCCSR